MPWPSYIDGCYPLVGRPMYPELWEGCVGAWCPSLGPTGRTLHDMSYFHQDGTLTNMDVSSDWALSGGRYALDFDNTDDYVDCGVCRQLAFTGPFSASCWFLTRDVPDYMILMSKHSGSTGWIVGVYASRVFLQINNAFNTTGGIPTVDTWTHVGCTWDGTTVRMYMNAGTESTTAASTITPDSSTFRIGGYSTPGTAPMNGQIDDARVYNRCLSHKQIAMLARRRGIAYETAPTKYRSQQLTSNRRRRLLTSGVTT